jgi:hypothetical protein
VQFTSKKNFSAVSFSLKLQALIAAKRVLCVRTFFYTCSLALALVFVVSFLDCLAL